ncbi:FAD-dependent hydroxylase [cyanobacterium endosymbiont of Epithemia turgida]|uniref:FAD-dependent hydroxylase n=1 Tax=cyanobacterium endosymbiont of Epithemia turgida TaxID=718217 RepID=UPI0004D1F6BD|nr:FAD-dependent hydroxylase [cyanobacterium endosymbiont of Epithemia turgida]BAP17007.1 2-octaprenyl-6-methoxyphenyl hydroxylase [cyanobacterium endosymbiont of Epithemia turgida isolate EtSB Lake Yunoko]
MTVDQLNASIALSKHTADYDLTIVGGGIVGMILATALKKSGLKIVIVETQVQIKVASKPQAYALSLLSARILDAIGIWEKIFPKVGKFHSIRLSDADYPQVVEFQTTDIGTDYLGYVGEHKMLLETLQTAILEEPEIRWLCPAEVIAVDYQDTEAVVKVKVEGQLQQIRSKLVIGADGSQSPIRLKVGIKTQGWKYWQSCVTFTVKHNAPSNNIAFERFWYSGPMGILPLPGNRCQIVWTAPHSQAKAIRELDETKFLSQLQQRTGGILGKLELVSDRFIFPIQLMQSERYTKHRLVLVGDAAHCCHPLGGQGLNLGIRDVAALAEVLQKAHQQGEDIGSLKVLKRYEHWRRSENWVILGFTDFLNRLFSNQWWLLMILRRLGLWLINTVPLFKRVSLQLMTGLLGKMPQLLK